MNMQPNTSRKWGTPAEYEQQYINAGCYSEHQAKVFGLRDSIAERVALKMLYTCAFELYDTNSVAQNATMPFTLTFFNVPKGQSNKTYAQTNIITPNQLSNNSMAWITGIAMQPLFNLAPVDAANLHSLGHVEVTFKENVLVRGPLAMFPGGSAGQITAAASLGTAVALAGLGPAVSYTNGVPNVHNVFNIGEDGYLLWKNDSFNITYVTDTSFGLVATANGGTGLTLQGILHGLQVREVTQ